MINRAYKKKLDDAGNPIIVDGDFVMELVHEEVVSDIASPPNWTALKKALWKDEQLIGKALLTGSGAAMAFLVKVITDGETGIGTDEGDFLRAFTMLGVAWTPDEKATINQHLKDNSFSI